MKITPLQNNKGETIVEVMVSLVLLVLFLALLAPALNFAHTAAARAEARRTAVYELCGQLYPAGEAEPDWAADVSARDFSFEGDFSFSVRGVARQQLDAETTRADGTQEQYTFHRYIQESEP